MKKQRLKHLYSEAPNGTKYLQNATPDRTLLASRGRKSERGLRRFECETITTTGCLVDIPGSLRRFQAMGNGLLMIVIN